MDNGTEKNTTAIDLIKNTFYVEKSSQHQPVCAADLFQHPFKNEILLNTKVDSSYREYFDRVLEIGRPQQTPDPLSDRLRIDGGVATYLALPAQVKQQLKDMFVRARLTVESKPRGSIDRKLSYASLSSHKHAPIASRRKKSRKLSTVSRASLSSDVESRRKSGLVERSKEGRKGSREKRLLSDDHSSSASHALSKMMLNNRDVKCEKDSEVDFCVTPFYYNALKELDDDDDLEARRNEGAEMNRFAWSKRENARRKVTRWLRKAT